jgi:hypothetical protein
MDWRDN